MDSLIRDFDAAGHGIVTFASSQGREVSLERADWRNGAFTKALVEGLGEGKAARDTSGQITVSSLNYYVADRVKQLTGGVQHPVMSQRNIADFPIALAPAFVSLPTNPEDPAPGATTAPPGTGPTEAQVAYEAAAKINSITAFQAVIDDFPKTIQAKLAAAAIAQLEKYQIALRPPPIPAPTPSGPKPPSGGADVSAEKIEADLKLGQPHVNAIRQALTRLGYKTGGEKGAVGPATRGAIAQYQLALGLPTTGYVSLDLLASLGVPYGSGNDHPVDDARKYTVASLGPDADPRLVKAVAALSDYEILFDTFKGHIYIAVLTWSADWDKAKQLSELAGGHLVTITSKAENDFVYALFSKDDRMVALDAAAGGSLNGPWIGLYQAKGAREPSGGWRWVTDEPVNFANWQPWGPDNYRPGENFGRFWGTTQKTAALKKPISWDDAREGDVFRGFIVELE